MRIGLRLLQLAVGGLAVVLWTVFGDTPIGRLAVFGGGFVIVVLHVTPTVVRRVVRQTEPVTDTEQRAGTVTRPAAWFALFCTVTIGGVLIALASGFPVWTVGQIGVWTVCLGAIIAVTYPLVR